MWGGGGGERWRRKLIDPEIIAFFTFQGYLEQIHFSIWKKWFIFSLYLDKYLFFLILDKYIWWSEFWILTNTFDDGVNWLILSPEVIAFFLFPGNLDKYKFQFDFFSSSLIWTNTFFNLDENIFQFGHFSLINLDKYIWWRKLIDPEVIAFFLFPGNCFVCPPLPHSSLSYVGNSKNQWNSQEELYLNLANVVEFKMFNTEQKTQTSFYQYLNLLLLATFLHWHIPEIL